VWQAIAAFWSCRDLIRALRASTPEELRLERRFGLVLSRWLTTVFLAIVVVGDRFAPCGSVILVAIYVVLSVWIEVAPHHFLAGMQDEIDAKSSGENAVRTRDTSIGQRLQRKR